VTGGLTATDVGAGGAHTCATHSGGAVACWGSNFYGQLGNGSNVDSTTPVAAAGLTEVSSLRVGFQVSCAVLANIKTRCWGDNGTGGLGDGTSTSRNVPTATGLDTDGDGCSDNEEYGGAPALGGLRDPLNRWDFYDVNANRIVNAVDTGLVRSKFLVVPSPAEVIFDRRTGAAPYASGPPNNIINAVDIGLVRAQFNNTCAALP
jgi:alpha-tubulin suppressor-like RCC1 family protein